MCVYVCVHIQYVHLQFSVYTHFASVHTYFFTSVTHTVIQYKQNHLCVVWLGIAVVKLCWAQPGHCWGLGSPVSTEREIKREWEGDGERTHTDTYTHTHTQSVCLHLVFSPSPGSSWPEYLSAFNELTYFGCETLVIKSNKTNIPGLVWSQKGILLREKAMEECEEREQCALQCAVSQSSPVQHLGNNPD